ncbi:MAG: T9SS type A sorting domain-containing protein [Ignavibacteria bacterium]|nr:T9SS type A sorting domain-containing protein [Ignavibacteria bacterium]
MNQFIIKSALKNFNSKQNYKIYTAIFLFIFLINWQSFSQIDDPDYSQLPSVVKQPENYIISPKGTMSIVETTGGYDNFYLGVDFGEPYIVSNPRDPLNAVCAFNINNLYYTLNGIDWTKNIPSFTGYNVVGDPVLTYDSLGNVYYGTLYQNGNIYGIAVVKSTNKGISWLPPVSVYSTTVGLADKEWISSDQTAGPYSNYLYMGWRQFGSSGMRFCRSTDGGQTWSAATTLTGDQGAYISVGPGESLQGGSVYFAAAYSGYIIVYRSTNGGQTFGAYTLATPYIVGPGTICNGRYTVKNCIRTDYFPRMAADNSYGTYRGNVYVVYAANPNAGADKADIFMVKSTNYGQTWSTPLRVNDDLTTTDQWMPAVSVDLNGRIIVTWYDSRVDTTGNLMTQIFSAVSTNGGSSFLPNQPVTTVSFNPNNMAVGQGSGQAYYIGDYIGNNPTRKTAWHCWMDARKNNLGSYSGYYPDFAMTISEDNLSLTNNDSAIIRIKIPSVKGPFNDRVKFTAVLDSAPPSGNINFNFIGKDSLTGYPDSLNFKITTPASAVTGVYKIAVYGAGSDGTPVHRRYLYVLVNMSSVSIGTNREGIVTYKVDGIEYTTRKLFTVPTGTVMNIQAVSPKVQGGNQYVFLNWSDFGDTTHNISVNGTMNLTAYYKVQFKLIINSTVGNTFGGNIFYDSAATGTFGVLSRLFNYNGTLYQFRGWTGNGTGSYTSPDSTGNDSTVTITLYNAIVETARWTTYVGISKQGTEIPTEYKLEQNYPNPFNPETNIKFAVTESGFVELKIYDILGRTVKNLITEKLSAGFYIISFNAESLPSGTYFYTLKTEKFSDIKKMILIR